MHKRAFLLAIVLGAVALSGCTRANAHKTANNPNTAVETPSPLQAGENGHTHGISSPAPRESPPPVNTETPAIPATDAEDPEAVLNELESALRDLEGLLGATADWDIDAP
ncbi:MAG: hypothetical protein ACK2T2_06165 [Anaerolineales bacterium]|jgi:hypothetical protein